MVAKSNVGDYVSLQRGTTYKGTLVGKPGPALLGLGSIRPGGGFREGDYKTYGGECPEKLMLFPGDLFVSLKGATKDGEMIGSIARVPSSVPSGRLTQDTVKLVFHDSDQETANYLYWLLRTPQYREYCAAHATGSAVVALSREDFLAYPIPAATPARMQIVKLFEALERKIEVSRRMNESLESIAQALFRYCIGDFDPALGANRIGWKTGRFGDVVELLREQESPLSSPETVFHHHSIPAFDNGQRPEVEVGWNIKSLKLRVPSNVILLSKLNPEIERVWLVDVQPDEHAICSTEFLVLRPRPPFGLAFAYCLARSSMFRQQIEALVTGTSKSHQRAQAESVLQLPIVLPPPSIVQTFETHSSALLARTLSCRRESRTLSAIRETLLPRLVSGEIPVSFPERIVGGQA